MSERTYAQPCAASAYQMDRGTSGSMPYVSTKKIFWNPITKLASWLSYTPAQDGLLCGWAMLRILDTGAEAMICTEQIALRLSVIHTGHKCGLFKSWSSLRISSFATATKHVLGRSLRANLGRRSQE
jgi:hypothetical protein